MYSLEEFVENRGIATLNSEIVDKQTVGYQMDVDSAIGKKAVSSTAHEVEVNVDDMTVTENENIFTHANEVLAFMPRMTWNKLRSSRASLPSPSELVDNVRIIPTRNALPTPLTTAEWGQAPSTGITWADKPAGIDGKQPAVFLVDPRKIEYRPVIRSYNTGMTPIHSANRFNFHMTWRGAVGVKPWYNSVRIVDTA